MIFLAIYIGIAVLLTYLLAKGEGHLDFAVLLGIIVLMAVWPLTFVVALFVVLFVKGSDHFEKP